MKSVTGDLTFYTSLWNVFDMQGTGENLSNYML